ncbi:geranylgeranylglyceryl/heptaprenylglyceryl phosphate synthase [Methanonatronarchaeum sp. AMET6-2]|uniref:geranylgeranylglyceryl/heptaprenylglyceryl phosphate synthase n=1 Tax=Methanonatronarchaeum sp. AMET6-2 TaxID=2933293 RepID=UPI00120B98D8|nr:geranylgeranylglyceryl/heptaprenylglyceryl phosphate synthase [Methanonatronarchaeum sp. AMET6-2]RZN61716.1 MAG: geranylgeranylglyceryl/heptaprenylglyceryl phosphate synthase [Methanonatronarchaeia archaeon]UOY10128.1 geranylgeranylglyceryl/heptaprenylglyceryl phosphate synthase [Methanonatronarchaeum sp. AMET6-2]
MTVRRIFGGESGIHLTLIDPDEQAPEEAGEIAFEAMEGGSSGIMVGGSTVSGQEVVDKTVEEIKQQTTLPVILFPQDTSGLTGRADGVFFMSLLNSRDPMYITGFQMRGAPVVKRLGLEPLPMAYLVIEPGGTVGYVSDARPIPREKPEIAVSYALAGEYMGMEYIYLEAGSGADNHVPLEMVGAVSKATDAEVIVGGGIRRSVDARKLVEAGADIIVTGTLVEDVGNVRKAVSEITSAIKKDG